MSVKLAVPFEMTLRRGIPEARTVPEDSDDEIAQCVRAICATEIGQRLESPTFGIPDPAFVGVEVTELRRLVTQWEPRAESIVDAELVDLVQTVRVGIQ